MTCPIKTLVIIILCALSSHLMAEPANGYFLWDSAKAKCIDRAGKEGLNLFDPKIVFKGFSHSSNKVVLIGRNVQCTDFTGVDFSTHIGVGYSVLKEWDFRGSNFTGADLKFNFIVDGLFAGSSVEKLKIGYGRVTAKDSSFNSGDMPLPKKL